LDHTSSVTASPDRLAHRKPLRQTSSADVGISGQRADAIKMTIRAGTGIGAPLGQPIDRLQARWEAASSVE
jgi:hypothetical protein